MATIKKAFAMSDVKISFVSLVDKAANKQKFLITKSENGTAEFQSFGQIIEKNADEHYVTGIVYEPMTADTDDNYMTEPEIIKAAYWFAENGDSVDLQHSFEKLSTAKVVENWVTKSDSTIGGKKIRKGTWVMTVKIADDEIWSAIEKGAITGFSMGGVGKISEEDVKLDDKNTSDVEKNQKKGILKKIAECLGIDMSEAIEKGEMKNEYDSRTKHSNFWTAFESLQKVLLRYRTYNGEPVFESDEATIRQALAEFNTILTELLAAESITKSIKPNTNLNMYLEEDNMDMKELSASISKAVADSLNPIMEKIVEKKEAKDETPLTKEGVIALIKDYFDKNIQKSVADAVSEAISPIAKAMGVETNLEDGTGTGGTDDDSHYLHGFI